MVYYSSSHLLRQSHVKGRTTKGFCPTVLITRQGGDDVDN